MITTVILTYNEAKEIEACIASLSWCDDVIVLDSFSTDETVAIALSKGARVHKNKFEGFGHQRNFALEQIPTKYEWVLFLDADERSTNSFHKALVNAISSSTPEISGFYCCWKMILGDTWLKYSDNFPKWQFRVAKKGSARFINFGHGQKEGEVKGKLGYIKEPYLHFGFSKGWSHWLEKHNHYSSQEAEERLKSKSSFKLLFSKHPSQRNIALKYWVTKIPGWPLLRFLYTYVFKLGFLEGSAGLVYAVNIAYYEFLIKIKMKERQPNLKD